MILICANCSQEMEQFKENFFNCLSCGATVEQLTIETVLKKESE